MEKLNEKDIIIKFLEASGFKENGTLAYTRESTGTIFIREWSVLKVMWQIMELGEKHHAKKVRDVIMMNDAVETCIFNPQV